MKLEHCEPDSLFQRKRDSNRSIFVIEKVKKQLAGEEGSHSPPRFPQKAMVHLASLPFLTARTAKDGKPITKKASHHTR